MNSVVDILKACDGFIVVGTGSVIQATSSKVIVKDSLVFVQGGQIVGRLDAEYDFADLHPALHATALGLIMQQRIRLGMIDPRVEEQREARYQQRLAEFNGLPWWKKLFRPKPGKYDAENDS